MNQKIGCEDLTICIPAYNEEMSILKTLRELRKKLPTAEIIVLDDGSTDNTKTIAKSVEGVIVLSHWRRKGYGAALKTCMKSASRRVVAWFDGDGQHSPEDLLRVVRPVISGEKDMVIGVRGKESNQELSRMSLKKVFTAVVQLIAREKLPDINSGLRAFRLNVIRRYFHLLPDGFSASSTSTLLMLKRGYRVGYESITTVNRLGKSKVKLFKDGWYTIKLSIRILVLFEAFSFFTFCASIQMILGLTYGIYLALIHGKGFPTLAAIIVISSILTFLIGIVCDQITELRKERFED